MSFKACIGLVFWGVSASPRVLSAYCSWKSGDAYVRLPEFVNTYIQRTCSEICVGRPAASWRGFKCWEKFTFVRLQRSRCKKANIVWEPVRTRTSPFSGWHRRGSRGFTNFILSYTWNLRVRSHFSFWYLGDSRGISHFCLSYPWGSWRLSNFCCSFYWDWVLQNDWYLWVSRRIQMTGTWFSDDRIQFLFNRYNIIYPKTHLF